MSNAVVERRGTAVLVVPAEGAPIAGPQDALDLIGDAFGHDADVVAVPVARLDESFFRLRSGLAGDIMQKFVNYQVRLAVVGDISAHVAASDAFRDLVRESNQGRHIWFVSHLDALDDHL